MIEIGRGPRGYRLTGVTQIPRPREEVFAFFADARNLQTLTPPWLHFQIKTPGEIRMASGTLIDYRLRVRGFPIAWQTLIDAWDPPHRFSDHQLRGPYRWWEHEHRFEEHEGGTRMTDTVDYGIPLGFILHPLLIRRDLQSIFAYREEMMRRIFPSHQK